MKQLSLLEWQILPWSTGQGSQGKLFVGNGLRTGLRLYDDSIIEIEVVDHEGKLVSHVDRQVGG